MQMSSLSQSKKISKALAQSAKLYQKNKVKEARKLVGFLLSSGHVNAHPFFQIGVAALNAQDFTSSISLLKHALELDPDNEILHSNIYTAQGSAYSGLEDYEKAVESFTNAVSKNPNNSGALNNRAIAHLKSGDSERAISDFEKAHSLDLGNIGILLNLGDILVKSGQNDKALAFYTESLALHSENASLHFAMGKLKNHSTPNEAFAHFRKAALLEPQNDRYLLAYSEIFQLLPNLETFEGLENDLLLLFSSNSIPWNNLNRITTQHIKAQPPFREIRPFLLQAVEQNGEIQVDYKKSINALANNLFLTALKRIRLVDPEIEKLLETFRRQTLTAVISGAEIEEPLFKLLSAILLPLAHYSFASEFVFSETATEQQMLETLIEKIEAPASLSNQSLTLHVLILSCYRPLYRLPFAKDLRNHLPISEFEELAELVRTAIDEPSQEFKSYQSFPQITPISDSISLSVQAQYEENPYPRWSHLHHSGSSSYAFQLSAIVPQLKTQQPSLPLNPKVLIAGCGTGRQPISTARSFPETEVLAVDLSLASLAYAKRKAGELGVKNIDFAQADIMELGSINRKFDIIECAGVLHHMNDPIAGWRVLCDLLDDNGYMLIGLYSELGRSDIVASRKFIKENGYTDDIENIRKCRKALMALEDGHPAKKIVIQSDFYTTSACRDLIFHVQEHRFTIPELQQIFDKLNLEFLCFNSDIPQLLTDYRAMFPDDPGGTNLENWHSFEQKKPRAFATMYKFWVRKKKS